MAVEALIILGKTEQRIAHVVRVLRDAAPEQLTYGELGTQTGTSYDVLLYILTTLVEVGMVERLEEPAGNPGRPKCFFRWVGAQVSGT